MALNFFPAIDQKPVIINLVLVIVFSDALQFHFSVWKHHEHITVKGQHSSFYSVKANYN